jgi:serine protease
MLIFRRARLWLTVLTGACWLITVTAQDAPSTARRAVINDVTPPAMDLGVRDADPPRPPRGSGDPVVDASDTAATPYVDGSLIVKFRPGTTVGVQGALLALVDGGAPERPAFANFDLVPLPGGSDVEAAAARLAAQPDVEYAQPRYRLGPRFVPNDPLYGQQWNFPLLDMARAWDINLGASPSIIVAVLDTGVAYRSALSRFATRAFTLNGQLHPSLGTIDIPFAAAPDLGPADRFVTPRDFIWGDTLPLDFEGHGTHVAGTLGQLTNNGVGAAGMAGNVRIMPVKVISGPWDIIFGNDATGTDDVVAQGIRYAVDNGAKVLNMSIGRNGNAAPVLRDALQYATSRGAFVAIAAGNEFLDGNPVSRPADSAPEIEGVVSVGAIDRNSARARYSNTGTYVELVAPGGDQVRGGVTAGILQQTYNFDFTDTYLNGPVAYRAPRFDAFTYQYLQGTSMATPHVAGFAAMLMQQGITSPAAIEAAMKKYATDLGAAGRDNEYGYGLINPRAALRGMGLAK